ncbi:MAG: CDP-alcohol phosphatidyltransferase family protein, partial [Porphyromonas sp.]
MKLHRFVLTLGSNSQPQEHLAFVLGELERLCLERLTFSPARESAPVCFGLSDAPFTDWLDGFLARRLGQTSAFGAFLDPV